MLLYAIGEGRRQMQAYLRKLDPDVVHAHDTYGLMVKGLEIPRVFTIHGFIHEDTFQAHARFSRLRSILWRWIETSGWAEQPHIIAISPYVRERLRGIYSGTIHDVENPVAPEFFSIERAPIKGTIFSAGLICPRKNTMGLLEAALLLKNDRVPFQLRLAGHSSDVTYAALISNFVRAKGLSGHARLLGSVGSGLVREELAAASVFALVSFEEGAPMGIAEAMAAGVPVVTSNRCGMPYMVRHGYSGFLTNPNDPKDIAGRLKALLSEDLVASRFAHNAKELALTLYHPDSVAERTAGIYRELAYLKK
jgi:glycosyltransferase involved in cell wall biosynthesis